MNGKITQNSNAMPGMPMKDHIKAYINSWNHK